MAIFADLIFVCAFFQRNGQRHFSYYQRLIATGLKFKNFLTYRT